MMKLILTLTSLLLVQADQRAYCENNGAVKTHHRGSALYDGDIMVIGDCYNYGEDECPKNLSPPSPYSISQYCKRREEDQNGDTTYIWYDCSSIDNLFEFVNLFKAKGWTCDDIH